MLIFDRKKSIENDRKSKHGHETHQYWSVDNDFSVVAKLRSSAFQRHQARQNPSSIRSIRDDVLISNQHFFIPHIGPFFTSRLQCRSIKIHTSILRGSFPSQWKPSRRPPSRAAMPRSIPRRAGGWNMAATSGRMWLE